MKYLLPAVVFFFSVSVFAGKPIPPLPPKLQVLFDAIKDTGVNYKPDGAVCEQVVILQMQQSYPADHYALTSGVEYDVGDGTVGELDLVVVNKDTQHVELVGEVKCWHDFSAAMDKAKMQRDRFMWHLTQFASKIVFTPHDPDFKFTESSFHGLEKFIFISQMGGVRKGFDVEIPYNLGEMQQLQEALVRCQNSGRCPLDKAH